MRRASLLLTSMFSVAALVVPASAQILPEQPATPAAPFEKYISIKPGRIALVHANLIDGTGTPARPDQTIIIENGRIVSVSDSRSADVSGARVIDLTGKTVFPGIVGMHNHLFHIAVPNISPTSRGEEPLLVPQMSFSSPRLYLAGGVTTIRTAGSVEPDADLNIKREADRPQHGCDGALHRRRQLSIRSNVAHYYAAAGGRECELLGEPRRNVDQDL
jgi:hypothetical protein